MTQEAICTNDSAVRRHLIREAFKKLPIAEGQELRVEFAVNDLMNVDPVGPGTTPSQFRDAYDWRKGHRRSRKVQGFLPKPVARPSLQHRQEAIKAIGGMAPDSELRRQLYQSALRALRRRDAQAKLEATTNADAARGGRPANLRAHATALLVAYHYTRVTGLAPTRRVTTPSTKDGVIREYGPFHDFLAAIFVALGLRHSVDCYARFVVQQRKRGRRKASS